jgi:hypothetical protein
VCLPGSTPWSTSSKAPASAATAAPNLLARIRRRVQPLTADSATAQSTARPAGPRPARMWRSTLQAAPGGVHPQPRAQRAAMITVVEWE